LKVNERLAEQVREALRGTREVKEKKMFGALAFLVRGKMCVCVGESKIMCQVDPTIRRELVKKKGV
jgi:TfoX/Sxy family transcriptional regulator of competence genes